MDIKLRPLATKRLLDKFHYEVPQRLTSHLGRGAKGSKLDKFHFCMRIKILNLAAGFGHKTKALATKRFLDKFHSLTLAVGLRALGATPSYALRIPSHFGTIVDSLSPLPA